MGIFYKNISRTSAVKAYLYVKIDYGERNILLTSWEFLLDFCKKHLKRQLFYTLG